MLRTLVIFSFMLISFSTFAVQDSNEPGTSSCQNGLKASGASWSQQFRIENSRIAERLYEIAEELRDRNYLPKDRLEKIGYQLSALIQRMNDMRVVEGTTNASGKFVFEDSRTYAIRLSSLVPQQPFGYKMRNSRVAGDWELFPRESSYPPKALPEDIQPTAAVDLQQKRVELRPMLQVPNGRTMVRSLHGFENQWPPREKP